MTITLPWPPKELSPNARIFRLKKAAIAKAYRAECLERALMHDTPELPAGNIAVRIDFYPPDKRRRDLDNMLASAKQALDAVADAWGVDDQRFGLWLSREEPVKGGKIVIRTGPGAFS